MIMSVVNISVLFNYENAKKIKNRYIIHKTTVKLF